MTNNQIILDIIINADPAVGDLKKIESAIKDAIAARERLQNIGAGQMLDPKQVAELAKLNNLIEVARNKMRELTNETNSQNTSLQNLMQINAKLNQLKIQQQAVDKNDLVQIEKIKKETAELLEIKKELNKPAASQQEQARRLARATANDAENRLRDQQRQEVAQQRQEAANRRTGAGGVIGDLEGRRRELRLDLRGEQNTTNIRNIRNELSQVDRQLAQLTGRSRDFGSTLSSSVGLIRQGMLLSVGNFVADLGVRAVGAIKDIATESIMLADQAERTGVAFRTLLQSRSEATKLQQDIIDLAIRTPFEITELNDYTQRLLAMGVSSQEVLKDLESLGNVAAGVGKEKMPQLILAFGQVSTATKLTGAELRQFTEAGVPLLDELATVLGRTTQQIRKDISERNIDFSDVRLAFRSLTEDGGKFNNLMTQQSKTLSGQISNLKDNVEQLGVNIGSQLLPAAKEVVGVFSSIVSTLREWTAVPISEKLAEEQAELTGLVGAAMTLEGSYADRQAVLSEINALYPEFLRGLSQELITTEDLAKRLKEVNSLYDRRIERAAYREKVKEEQERLLEEKTTQIDLRQKKLSSLKTESKLAGVYFDESKVTGDLEATIKYVTEVQLQIKKARDKNFKDSERARKNIEAGVRYYFKEVDPTKLNQLTSEVSKIDAREKKDSFDANKKKLEDSKQSLAALKSAGASDESLNKQKSVIDKLEKEVREQERSDVESEIIDKTARLNGLKNKLDRDKVSKNVYKDVSLPNIVGGRKLIDENEIRKADQAEADRLKQEIADLNARRKKLAVKPDDVVTGDEKRASERAEREREKEKRRIADLEGLRERTRLGVKNNIESYKESMEDIISLGNSEFSTNIVKEVNKIDRAFEKSSRTISKEQLAYKNALVKLGVSNKEAEAEAIRVFDSQKKELKAYSLVQFRAAIIKSIKEVEAENLKESAEIDKKIIDYNKSLNKFVGDEYSQALRESELNYKERSSKLEEDFNAKREEIRKRLAENEKATELTFARGEVDKIPSLVIQNAKLKEQLAMYDDLYRYNKDISELLKKQADFEAKVTENKRKQAEIRDRYELEQNYNEFEDLAKQNKLYEDFNNKKISAMKLEQELAKLQKEYTKTEYKTAREEILVTIDELNKQLTDAKLESKSFDELIQKRTEQLNQLEDQRKLLELERLDPATPVNRKNELQSIINKNIQKQKNLGATFDTGGERKVEGVGIQNASDKQISELKAAIQKLYKELEKKNRNFQQDTKTAAEKEREQLQKRISYWKQFGESVFSVLGAISRRNVDAIHKALDNEQNRYKRALEIRDSGNATYLEQEEQRITKMEEMRRNELSKQQMYDRISQISSIGAGIAKVFSSSSGLDSFGKIAAIMALLPQVFGAVEGLLPPIQGFKDGTPYVQLKGAKKGIDTVPAMLTEGERVVPVNENLKYGKAFDLIQSGMFTPSELMGRLNFNEANKQIKGSTIVVSGQDFTETNKILKEIANRESVNNTQVVLKDGALHYIHAIERRNRMRL